MVEICPYDNELCPFCDCHYIGHSLWSYECTADPGCCEECEPPELDDR